MLAAVASTKFDIKILQMWFTSWTNHH